MVALTGFEPAKYAGFKPADYAKICLVYRAIVSVDYFCNLRLYKLERGGFYATPFYYFLALLFSGFCSSTAYVFLLSQDLYILLSF